MLIGILLRRKEFVRQINEGNSFNIDTDFVIRCLFAVSEIGTKFELDLLRKKDNVEDNVDRLRPRSH